MSTARYLVNPIGKTFLFIADLGFDDKSFNRLASTQSKNEPPARLYFMNPARVLDPRHLLFPLWQTSLRCRNSTADWKYLGLWRKDKLIPDKMSLFCLRMILKVRHQGMHACGFPPDGSTSMFSELKEGSQYHFGIYQTNGKIFEYFERTHVQIASGGSIPRNFSNLTSQMANIILALIMASNDHCRF